jgi:hypothetical protein
VTYYVLDGDRTLISTESKRAKVRDVIRDGWASICVLGPKPSYPGVTVEGPARILTTGIGQATARIFAEGLPETLRAFAWRVRTGPLDGFVAAKGVELIVDVVHLRSDRVHRQVEVAVRLGCWSR